MATATVPNSPSWTLAQGIHDLCFGMVAHLQGRTPILDRSTAAATIESSPPSQASPSDVSSLDRSVAAKAAETSVQKVLDCQTFIVSLFTKELPDLCRHLRLLEDPIAPETEAMIAAASNEHSAQAVREFKFRTDAVTLTYKPLTDRMLQAAESNATAFPNFALRDAAKAEKHANELFSWARSFLPKETDSLTDMDKATKLRMMPYVVAMVYAVRVKLDVHSVESSDVPRAERADFFERSRDIMNKFVATVDLVLRAMLADSSLLALAMDYNLALTTYMTIRTAIQASVQLLVAPNDAPAATALWDDGLSQIRALFCRGTEDNDTTTTIIPLSNVAEKIAWAQFIGQELTSMQTDDLRTDLYLDDLLFALGENLDDDDDDGGATAILCLVPDCKRMLLQLPPVHTLRAAFHCKLTSTAVAAIDTDPTLLQSVARIQNASQLAACADAIAARNSPRLIHTFTGHSSVVYCVAVSADGERIVSGSDDKTAKVWSRTTGQLLCTFANHSGSVMGVALFSDSKRVVSGGDKNDKTVRIWSIVDGGSSVTELWALTGHTDNVFGVAVSPDDSTVASASRDNTIRLWNAHTGHCEATLTGHSNCVTGVAFSLDGCTLASSSEDETAKLWNVRTHSLERTLTGHTGYVLGVAFAGADGDRLVSCSYDMTIKVWNWQSGKIERTLTGHADWVGSVAVFSDGERLASGSADNTIKFWNVRSRELLHTLTEHTNVAFSVAVSRDGRTLVSGSFDNSVKVWKLR